jgi:hypothetical protein
MDKRIKAYFSLLLLLVMFNFFFWGEKLGLNFFIFLFFCSIALITLNDENLKNKNVIVSLLAVLYSLAMVVVVNSEFAGISAIISFMVFTGFMHQQGLKTVFNAGFTAMADLIIFPYNAIVELQFSSGKFKPLRTVFRVVRIAFIPLMIFIVFYSIYAYSNPVFNDYSVTFWDSISEYLYDIFRNYPVLRFFYIFFGLFLLTGILFNRNIKTFSEIDGSFLDTLLRDKTYKVHSRVKPVPKKAVLYDLFSYRFKFNTLKLETRMGMLLIFMMNVLLLLLNIIDIEFTWLGFNAEKVDNLAYYVHNGTYLLIFSILLSMAILLYFFRGNQNYFTKNKLLKYGAYLWIVQNGIMAISVALRNVYYIDYYYALSYKRIGVMIFLLLTMTGIITMFIKIYSKKTTFWLLKVNSSAAFIVLLLMASTSWDVPIAKFNLQNPEKQKIDIGYLLRLSDQTLPILDGNKELLDRNYPAGSFLFDEEENGLKEYNWRVKNFIERQNRYSWLSWNLPDHNTMKFYKDFDIKRFDGKIITEPE